VIRRPDIQLDTPDAAQIVQEVLRRRLGYVPEWQPSEQSADAALVWVFAHYLQTVLQRLQQTPDKNKLAFLDLLGLSLVPAAAARAPIVFQLAADIPDSLAPANTQVAAPPPPGSNAQIVFETEHAVGLAAAQLQEVVSLWPGRDQYLDHTAAFLAGEPFQLFRKPLLHNTPHHLYIAHNTLLALSGSAQVEVEMELTRPGSEPLRLLWHYWDGKVWRGFKSARPACSEKEAEYADSTAGLTRSGRFVLEADCAESTKTMVNGSEAFWIRAQLDEPLLPDPATALPLIDNLRLSTLIKVPLQARLVAEIHSNTVFAQDAISSRLHGTITNEAGQALNNIRVKITSPDDANFVQKVVNASNGAYDSGSIAAQPTYEMQAAFLNLEASTRLGNLELNRDFGVDLTFQVVGLDPEQAFADGTQLDVTKPFYPFGQQPQPGATFYFSQAAVFSKPGARVQIYIARTESPLDAFDITTTAATTRTTLPHLIAWEYWNSQRWVTMFQSSSTEPARDLDTTGIVELTVPPDMAPTLVNEQEGLWMRARLVSGGFGFKTTIPTNAGRNTTNNFTFVITQPPALAAFRMGYSWRHGPFHPEQVLTYNDFQYEDRTYEAIWPGNTFAPFTYVRDVTPALYLGFNKKLPVAQIGLYVDIVEQRGEASGPALVWEYHDGANWRELAAADETQQLRLPGIVTFIAAEDSQPLARFGTARHWVRGRLKEDGPPGEPTLHGIFTNAVWAAQRQTLNDVVLGTSSGLPNQVLRFSQIPVLAGERLEVQELSGKRANVEWRLVARELAPTNANIIHDLEALLGREDVQTEIIQGDLRLRRDRNKQVVEVWVRWREQPHLLRSGPDDRHYVLDRARGLVFFGNGEQGRIPPPGSPLLIKQYRTGGGLAGNVAARTITQLLGALSGVQAVFNPRAAEGGADGETLVSFRERGPQAIRHRGRAITPADYEVLAHEASPAVAMARAIPTRNASGRPMPGWITLLIIPRSEERRPWPSFGLRQQVSNYLAERAPAGLTAAHQIYVTGPDYLPVDVAATLAPREASEAGAVEARVRQALEVFLHPLRGGPTGDGWELGRHLYLSDVAAVLERIPGVDYVEELGLSVNGTLQGERVTITAERMVTAGQIRLTLQTAEG
jgi:uncharacterized phage protein gp47/JayE